MAIKGIRTGVPNTPCIRSNREPKLKGQGGRIFRKRKISTPAVAPLDFYLRTPLTKFDFFFLNFELRVFFFKFDFRKCLLGQNGFGAVLYLLPLVVENFLDSVL